MGEAVPVLFPWFRMILLPFWEPVFIKLDDANQKVAFVGEQTVNLLAGFVGFMNGFVELKM